MCCVVISQDVSRETAFFFKLPEASSLPLDDNGGGADCVSSFDEAVQTLNYASVDGALERDCFHD